ncbi:hypothetical protein [Yinghuangia seranimata]|uniref:hypothetical protein n=1 Tax=Yinghuangia seranimata TaxID=408067 RepID=UPI00248AFE2B|nr:hypothetical protein [Yinghuangia seranimata]MDI2128544.1 hypothetical protein [Yinghuangia seranimata]
MNQKGLTRGDGLVFACVALIFGMSFAPFYKVGETSSSNDDFGSSSSSKSSSRKAALESFDFNAWTQGLWPVMAVVVLLPLLAFVSLVAYRYMQGAQERTAGGLTFRQWATAFGVTAAWGATWSLGGDFYKSLADAAGGGNSNVDSGHEFGAFVIMPATLVLALLLLVIDRVPGLTYPLFVSPPAYPPGYIPQQPGQPGYTGGYAPPMAPQGVPVAPVAQMPPPAAPAATQAPAPAPTPAAGSAEAPAAAAEFEQFWLAVPEERPLLPQGGLDKTPVATLVPGTWYLAVEPAGDGLVVEVEGKRGVLWNTAGIQRGE